jgi:hypothetical protein
MAKICLRRRTLKLPFVVVPFVQFSVDELGASADERAEPVAVEPSPAGLDSVEQLVGHRHAGRPPARPLGRALGQRDCCINGDGALEGSRSRATRTSGVGDDRQKRSFRSRRQGFWAREWRERADRLMQQCHLCDRSAGRSHQLHGVAIKLSTGHAAWSSSPVSHEDIPPTPRLYCLREVQSSRSTTLASRTALSHLAIGSPTWSICSPRRHNESSDAGC